MEITRTVKKHKVLKSSESIMIPHTKDQHLLEEIETDLELIDHHCD